MTYFMPAFHRFPNEATILGRIMAGYGELEFSLAHCISQAIDDLDMTLKAMFRARGEKQRVQIADALGRKAYSALGLETQFSEAVAGMLFCSQIRNQYAHCMWHDDYTKRLGFVDLEEIVVPNAVIADLKGLTIHHVDVTLLSEQEAYFKFIEQCFTFLNFEGRKRAGKLPSHPALAPKKVDRPLRHIP
jgi:hypothetical protein